VLGLPVDLTPTDEQNASIRFLTATSAGELRAIRKIDEATLIPSVRNISIAAKPGKKVNPATDAYDRLGFVIGAEVDAARLSRHMQEALETIELEIEPIECAIQV
jgi:S-sulfo-L-cysteine synthase (3-phospho-L-serine-dependent)